MNPQEFLVLFYFYAFAIQSFNIRAIIKILQFIHLILSSLLESKKQLY